MSGAASSSHEGFGRFEGIIAVSLTLVGWSSIPLFLKHFSHSIDAWTSNGWRYGFSALLWLPVLVLGARRGTLPVGLWRRALVPSLFNCAGQVCFTWAHYKIDPGLLTFGLRFQILFVAVGALLLFPAERRVIRRPGFIVGLLLVAGGTMGTILAGGDTLAGVTGFGVALAVASGLLFAAYGLSVRSAMEGVRPLVAFSAISQITAAGMIVLMLAIGERGGLGALDLGGEQFALLLLSAFIGIAMGHVCYYTSIARLGVAVSSGVIQLQPFFVSIGSLMLFGERLTVVQWLCGGVAVMGAGVVLRVQHVVKKRDRAESAAADRRAAERSAEEAAHERIAAYDELPVDAVVGAVEAGEHVAEEGDASGSGVWRGG